MATTKLTLSAEKSLIRRAKRYASVRKTSVSAMVSRFLSSVTEDQDDDSLDLGPLTREASGILTVPDHISDRQLVEDALLERYGSDE